MKPIVVAPLVALALAGGATGAYFWLSSGGGEEEAVRQPAAETPTPTASTASPSPTMAPTPLPGGKAPDDCATTEKSYVDPDGRFAFCYPADMELTTTETPRGLAATVQHPVTESDRVTATFGWVQEPSYVPCIESPTIIKNQRFQDVIISGKTVSACFQDHYDRSQPERLLQTTIDLAVPMPSGETILVLLAYSGAMRDGIPVTDIADRILRSASIN